MASVDLRGLTKRFGPLAVVDNVSLKIDHGQLVCLLGPSGCGKTTTLRLIAGFLEPSDGEIHVGERLVSSKARTLPRQSNPFECATAQAYISLRCCSPSQITSSPADSWRRTQ